MTNNIAARVFSGPWKAARLLYPTLPLLESESFLGPHRQLSEVLETAKEWTKNRRVIGAIKPYRWYNEGVAENLDRFKGKRIYFETAESKDVAGDKTLGYDRYAIRNLLGSKLHLMWEKLAKRGVDPSEWLGVPVSFILVANQYSAASNELVNVFDDMRERVNDLPQMAKRTKLGVTKRGIDESLPKQGFYQINPWLFDGSLANKIYGHNLLAYVTQHGLEKGVQFYVHITAMIMARVMSLSAQYEFDVFASQSSPYFKVMEWAVKYCKSIYGKDARISDWSRRLFDNVKMPALKESENKVVGRLETRIFNISKERTRRRDVTDLLEVALPGL